MTDWILAALLGLGAAALAYVGGSARTASPGMRALLAALRALAIALVAALALDAPRGRARERAPLVVLDASASWTRGGDTDAFARATARARSLARGDTLRLAGDSLRLADGSPAAVDLASALRPAADRAAAVGRPLVVVTDGEADDADALRAAPGGSRVEIVAPRRAADAALRALELPRAAAATDTIDARLVVGADAAGAGAGEVALLVGDAVRATARVDALPPFGERELRVAVPLGGGAGPTLVRAVVRAAGDVEPRNDTAGVALEISAAPAAVFVSGAPDYDARAIAAALRGTLALPVRGYVRVAPGTWRVEGTLAPVGEPEVRRVAAAASLLVVHGDTSVLGPPRALGRAALALVPTTALTDGEWYATGAPTSPLSGALSGVAWDSLPPLDAAPGAPAGEWVGLQARLGRAGPARPVVAGSEAGGRRVAVVGAGGFWRWQFRGGAAADAFAALWGGLFDWLAAGRADVRAALPADGSQRAGEPVRWRRGGADSVARVVLRRRGGPARDDTLDVRWSAGAAIATTPALPAGVWDVRAAGGASLLVVNPSRELLPRRPTLRAGAVGAAPPARDVPRLRDAGWAYLLALLLLCAEWLLRRRAGLR